MSSHRTCSSAGQRMIVAADEQERVAQQRLEVEIGLLRPQQVDAELGLPALDRLQHVVGRQVEDADADARILRVEGLDHLGQEVVGRGRHRADRHLARRPVAQLADAQHGGVELVQHPLRLEEEVAPDRAQPQLARVAVDQLHAQRRLELLDPPGQRRLRQVQRVGGGMEAAELGHGDEAAQIVQVGFHARHASFIQIIAFHTANYVWQDFRCPGGHANTERPAPNGRRRSMPEIPCVLMRGGTSRGPYFRAADLPADPAQRDRLLAAFMGSGHDLQVDGIGGGHPQTSKIAIVGPSSRPGADIDYLFAQAGVQQATIDTSPNCGNMLAGVGPFAIEAGMFAGHRARDPGAHPQRQHRQADRGHRPDAGRQRSPTRATPRSTACPAPPPRSGSSFLDAAGAKTGRLLPTGSARDRIGGLEATCIDMAMPMVLLRAGDLGKTGHERAGRARHRPRLPRPPGGDPPRGRRADGPGRRRRARHPQAGAGLRAAGRRHHRRPLLHPARLPPLGRGHRCDRPRHRLRAAGQPRPGVRRAAAARARRHGHRHRAPGRPHPDRARAGAAGRRGPGPARLARPHRPPAVRRLGVRSRLHHLNLHQGDP